MECVREERKRGSEITMERERESQITMERKCACGELGRGRGVQAVERKSLDNPLSILS